MSKNKDPQDSTLIKKVEKPLTRLNSLFNDVIDNISFNTFGTDTKHEKELKQFSKEIDEVVFQEIKNLTSFTGDDISTFLVKLFNTYDNKDTTDFKNIEDIFSTKDNAVFQFFQDRYKNINLLYDDLNMICSQLSELQEAVDATRDAIVTSDDIGQSITRSLKFKGASENNDYLSYIKVIEDVEKKFKLPQKIKNHIIPKALQYGTYYAYAIPYDRLFQRYYQNKIKDEQKMGATLESSISPEYLKEIRDSVTEATKINISGSIEKVMSGYLKDIEVYNDEIAIPIIEGVDLSALLETVLDNPDEFKKTVDKNIAINNKSKKTRQELFTDSTIDVKEKKDDTFSNVKGCYVKLIEPRKIIPVKILDQTIGYYYIHDTTFETRKSPFTTSIKINPNNAENVENIFFSKITDKIVKAFDKSFLEKNIKFKELIMNALTYNDIYKKQLKFQFIPKDYIQEFTVNEDENGTGTSILSKALFYAKLYLALLIFKMLSIITKSNDTKVHYVKQSGIDTNVVNKVQDVARSIKEKQINFMDLLNYNSMLSKVGANKDLFVPVGRSGERAIEWDIISGQDIQLNTELMEMLKSSFINNSGVPSVIMNYINEADYARTLVMANAKFIGRVVTHQGSFNGSITEFYKKVLAFSTDIPEDLIDDFEYILAAPKSLNNTNLTDLISNADQTITFVVKSLTGDVASPSDDDNILKDIIYKKMSREILPMIPWDVADRIYEESKLELVKLKADKKVMDNGKTEEN